MRKILLFYVENKFVSIIWTIDSNPKVNEANVPANFCRIWKLVFLAGLKIELIFGVILELGNFWKERRDLPKYCTM